MLFSIPWSIAAVVDNDGRQKFDSFYKELLSGKNESCPVPKSVGKFDVPMPDAMSCYDVFFEVNICSQINCKPGLSRNNTRKILFLYIKVCMCFIRSFLVYLKLTLLCSSRPEELGTTGMTSLKVRRVSRKRSERCWFQPWTLPDTHIFWPSALNMTGLFHYFENNFFFQSTVYYHKENIIYKCTHVISQIIIHFRFVSFEFLLNLLMLL